MGNMEFEIVKREECPGCYGAGSVLLNGKRQIAFVSELEDTGVIDLVDPDTMKVTRASDGPGGGMNIVPLKRDGEFFCIQKFYPVFKSDGAVVVWGYREDGVYHTKEVQPLPFVHRIEVLTFGGMDYLMCASLCKTKKFTDDWSLPGSVYVGEIDYENREIHDFKMIYTDVFQNHGLTKLGETGEEGILIAGANGVHKLVPPKSAEDSWEVVEIIKEAASDCVVADVDGDGVYEYGVIAPFHGEYFHVYKEIDGVCKKIYTLPGKHAFGHAIWGGSFEGKDAFLVGYRAEGMELYLICQEEGVITAHLVDEGTGPANVTVLHTEKKDFICAADRQTDRYTIYQKRKGE